MIQRRILKLIFLKERVRFKLFKSHSICRIFFKQFLKHVLALWGYMFEKRNLIIVFLDSIYHKVDVYWFIDFLEQEPFSKKHSIVDTTNTPHVTFIVITERVLQIEKNFRRHCLPWSQFRFCFIDINFRKSKVPKFQLIVVNKNVLKLYVSVKYLILS